MARRFSAFLGISLCVASVWYALQPFRALTFDEFHYYWLLRNGWQSVRDGSTNTYYASKSLPFLLARSLFYYGKGQSWDLADWRLSMLILNWMCLILGAWVIRQILRSRGHNELVPVAFSLYFCNRAFLQFYSYYSLLGDVVMLGVGALFCFGHFEKKNWAVWLSLVLASLTSPQLVIVILIYLSFSENSTKIIDRDETMKSRLQWFWTVIMGGPVIGIGLYAIYGRPEIILTAKNWGHAKYFEHPAIMILSVLTTVIAIFWSLRPLRKITFFDLLRAFSWRNALMGVLLVKGVSFFIASSAEKVVYPRFWGTLAIKLSFILSKPGPTGIFSNIIFFGLVSGFVLVFWREFADWVSQQGLGFSLGFCVSIILIGGIDGEVRHLTYLLPIAVVGVCQVASPLLRKLGANLLLWSGLVFSLNWILFLRLGPTHLSEKHLSAFGICWSKTHYLIGMSLAILVLIIIRTLKRRFA